MRETRSRRAVLTSLILLLALAACKHRGSTVPPAYPDRDDNDGGGMGGDNEGGGM